MASNFNPGSPDQSQQGLNKMEGANAFPDFPGFNDSGEPGLPNIEDFSSALKEISLNAPKAKKNSLSPAGFNYSMNSTKSSLGLLSLDKMANISTADITADSFSFPSWGGENRENVNPSLPSWGGENRENVNTRMKNVPMDRDSRTEIISRSPSFQQSPAGVNPTGVEPFPGEEQVETDSPAPPARNLSLEEYSSLFQVAKPFSQDEFLKPFPAAPSSARPTPMIATPKGISESLLQPAPTGDDTPSLPPRNPGKWGPQFNAVFVDTPLQTSQQLASPFDSFNGSGFPWEQIIGKESSNKDCADTTCQSEGGNDLVLDPSFCTGKISARSTSLGPGGSLANCTREESFSDFSKPQSFQGSYASHYSDNPMLEPDGSLVHSGFPHMRAFNPFDARDTEGQLQGGAEEDFCQMGQGDIRDFLDKEEQECLETNKFLEEEQMEEQDNMSVFSGISDKSIVLRNSGLWAGDTSAVDLAKLREETKKLSRCDYFRHNSSRLGSLEDSVSESERPGFGFVHKIRSPEHLPHALIDQPQELGSPHLTYTLPLQDEKGNKENVEESTDAGNSRSPSGGSGSETSSANSTYIPSGESTKTVVSMFEQSGTLKAEELANRLEDLANKLGTPAFLNVSYPDVVEDSLAQSEKNQSTVNPTEISASVPGGGTSREEQLNFSTISKALSDVSLSSDPQHFVQVMLSCLKNKARKQSQGDVDTPPSKQPKVHFSPRTDDWAATVSDVPNDKVNNNSGSPAGKASIERESESVTVEAILPSKPSIVGISPLKSMGVARSQSPKFAPVKPVTQPNLPTAAECSSAGVGKSSCVSEPATPRHTTPTPPLTKANSMPYSLENSSSRRPSVRHSSPVKKSAQLHTSLQAPTVNFVELDSVLQEAAFTPGMSVMATKHLHTSTPFHPNLNLSTVVVDNLTQNKSISPFLNPDMSINPVQLDVSTVSPEIFSSLKAPPVHVTPNVNKNREVQLPVAGLSNVVEFSAPECNAETVFCSHVWQMVSLPIKTHLSRAVKAALKVTNIWLGNIEIPVSHWNSVLEGDMETVKEINSTVNSLEISFFAKTSGAFTFNVGVLLPGGHSTSSVVRFIVEEPSLQLLTKNGQTIDFGTVATGCQANIPLLLVNGGNSTLPIFLEITSMESIFSLSSSESSTSMGFSIPGVKSNSGSGEGVAKELQLWASTKNIAGLEKPCVFTTQMKVKLGKTDSDVVLGTIQMLVRVGFAELIIDQQRLVFSCLPGEKTTQSLPLKCRGNIPVEVSVALKDTPNGVFSFEKQLRLTPGIISYLELEFAGKDQRLGEKCEEILTISLIPGGNSHNLRISTTVVHPMMDRGLIPVYKPGLKLGVINPASVDNQVQLAKFPVESDRSLINWLSAPLDGEEEQVLALRNSSSLTIQLNVLIRDSEDFRFVSATPIGGVYRSLKLEMGPDDTKNVKISFCPRFPQMSVGKLVIKPLNMKIGGKTYKASISLAGFGGLPRIELPNLARSAQEPNVFNMKWKCDLHLSQELIIRNTGNTIGFVMLTNNEEVPGVGNPTVNIVPNSILLRPGMQCKVKVTFSSLSEVDAITLAVFSGPELVRRAIRQAKYLPGAIRMARNPSLLGLDVTKVFPNEKDFVIDETMQHLSPEDVKQFYHKTIQKDYIRIQMPDTAIAFDQLTIEETMSESRIHCNSPPTMDSAQSHNNACPSLEIFPRQVILEEGGDAVVKLRNVGGDCIHWDLTCSGTCVTVSPPAGQLAAGGQAILLVSAVTGSLPNRSQGWKGTVEIFSEHSVDTFEVCIKPTTLNSVQRLAVIPRRLDMGSTVVGNSRSDSLALRNKSLELIQWRSVVEPSFFSLPQPSGLLNPGQSVAVPVVFRPAAPGFNKASLEFVCNELKGGKDNSAPGPPLIVELRATGILLTEAIGRLPVPPQVTTGNSDSDTNMKKPKSTGVLSLESEYIHFPATALGKSEVMKIKIKNRTAVDERVQITQLDPKSPFLVVHTDVEIKSQGFSRVPVQFKPLAAGEFTAQLRIVATGGRLLVANLTAVAVAQ